MTNNTSARSKRTSPRSTRPRGPAASAAPTESTAPIFIVADDPPSLTLAAASVLARIIRAHGAGSTSTQLSEHARGTNGAAGHTLSHDR